MGNVSPVHLRSTASDTSPFAPISIVRRQASHGHLTGNGDVRATINLIPREELRAQINNFACQVMNRLLYRREVTTVPILNGAMRFNCEMEQHLRDASHLEVMPLPARSYGKGRQAGPLFIEESMLVREKIEGRTVVIVDDVLDTGHTVHKAIELIKEHKPEEIITVFLLRKMHPEPALVTPDHWLFEVHSKSWVYGFGMDLDERYRHLNYICDHNSHLYDANGYMKEG